MKELPVKLPNNGVVQFAYVVQDISLAMEHWARKLRVGPWFVIENFAGIEAKYRGEPSKAIFDLALAFTGSVQVELIQVKDDKPSVFKEFIENCGYGFHHIGLASTDFDTDLAAFINDGHEITFTSKAPFNGRVAYLSTGENLPGMIELIDANAGFELLCKALIKANESWDGSDPIRKFESLE